MGTKLTDRQTALLDALIREHVRTAEPVGSASLASAAGLDVSSATIRNELAILEESGYISQPHTSAGRVPTEKGFRQYIARIDENPHLNPPPARPDVRRGKQREERKKHFLPLEKGEGRRGIGRDEMLREVARRLAEATEEVAIVGVDAHRLYYTGLSYLFSQPEFAEAALLLRFSEMMDRLEDVFGRMFARTDDDVRVLLGRETPFGAGAGMVLARYAGDGIVGIVGPVRMDYGRNVLLVRSAKELLEEMV